MKKTMATAIAAMMAAAATAVVLATAAQAAAGCRVVYDINGQWRNGFNAGVTITNLGDPVNGWALRFAFPADGQRVVNGWSAFWSQSGQNVTARNMTWNGRLNTNESVFIGFNGSWTSANPKPTAFTLNNVACTGSVPATSNPGTPTPVTPTPTPTRSVTPTPSRPPIGDFAPLIRLTRPAVDTTVTGPVMVMFEAVTEGPAIVTRVEFLANNTVVALGGTPGPQTNFYAAAWTVTGAPNTAVTYTLGARVYSNQGFSTTSPTTVQLTVIFPPTTGTNQPPTVSLINLDGTCCYQAPATIRLQADVTELDAGDVISRAELYNGTELIATSATGSGLHHLFQVPAPVQAQYNFTVKVYDGQGGTGTSRLVTLFVSPPITP